MSIVLRLRQSLLICRLFLWRALISLEEPVVEVSRECLGLKKFSHLVKFERVVFLARLKQYFFIEPKNA